MNIQLGCDSSAFWAPMGSAVIFGLTVATILTLVVIPVLYDRLDARAKKYHDKRKKDQEAEENEFIMFRDAQAKNVILEE
jgi:predicted RND superfamily exporter protein